MAKYKPQPLDLGDSLPKPTVQFHALRQTPTVTRDEILAQAAAFASSLGMGRVVSISQSESADGLAVTVWYWG